MLEIVIPESELFNDDTGEFVYTEKITLYLEHSLLSISKWESEYCKPFLSKEPKTPEEEMYYIKCMTVDMIPNNPIAYNLITDAMKNEIFEYMNRPMTATWFSGKEKSTNDIMTAERIYYCMTALNIPFSCENWHINRLLTLIKVCAEESKPKKDLKPNDLYKRNSALNKLRHSKMR